MDGEDSKPKKKIHVNAASVSVIELLGSHVNLLKYLSCILHFIQLVDLKAALYHKQQEVRQGGSGAVKVPIQTKKVSNKVYLI